MAEDTKPSRSLRQKSETIREKVEKTASDNQEAKPRRLQTTTRTVTKPFRAVGKVLGKISKYTVPPYFRNSWKELRQVTWPTTRETSRLTGAVIAFSIVFGAAIALADFGLDKLFKEVLLK